MEEISEYIAVFSLKKQGCNLFFFPNNGPQLGTIFSSTRVRMKLLNISATILTYFLLFVSTKCNETECVVTFSFSDQLRHFIWHHSIEIKYYHYVENQPPPSSLCIVEERQSCREMKCAEGRIQRRIDGKYIFSDVYSAPPRRFFTTLPRKPESSRPFVISLL